VISSFISTLLLHALILLFKIPMGTCKNFFEIYRKFGHAPSKIFVCPAVVLLLDTGVSEKPAA